MPCYESPHPADKASKESEIEAVKILCHLVTSSIKSGEPVARHILVWYIKHREIDLRYVLKNVYDSENETWSTATSPEYDAIIQSIDQAKDLLSTIE